MKLLPYSPGHLLEYTLASPENGCGHLILPGGKQKEALLITLNWPLKPSMRSQMYCFPSIPIYFQPASSHSSKVGYCGAYNG